MQEWTRLDIQESSLQNNETAMLVHDMKMIASVHNANNHHA